SCSTRASNTFGREGRVTKARWKFSNSRFCLTQRHKVTKVKMALFVFLAALCESRELLKLPDSTQRHRDAEVRRGNTTTKQGFSLRVSLCLSVSASRLRISVVHDLL